jgi:hypothetical protein
VTATTRDLKTEFNVWRTYNDLYLESFAMFISFSSGITSSQSDHVDYENVQEKQWDSETLHRVGNISSENEI